ncbi:MAG: superoxide dismutase [Parcubacteria group bacterium]|nr:superoxide dismutase [Parcubacteria group bacterium]
MEILPNSNGQFELPKLPYEYNALEAAIDARTMEIHYAKHHQGYVDKLNAALSGHADAAGMSLDKLLISVDTLPKDIRTAVQNHGGGHYNHSLFWQVMSPDGGGEPSGEIGDAITETFGSFGAFKEQFTNAALARFGSGWAWLFIRGDGNLVVSSTPNQDSPLMEGSVPILGLDVWEHAYYLRYQNKRPEYIEAWWNVVNWDAVNKLFITNQ